MSAFAASSAVSRRRRRPRPTFEDRLIARMLARPLDRELSDGVPDRASDAHWARARQLTGDRTRRAVANALEGLIDRAERPASILQIRSAPCREQVRDASGVIRATAARLRSAEPLEARGIARLKTLLCDPSGPCYAPDGARALTLALRDASKLLDTSTTSHNL